MNITSRKIFGFLGLVILPFPGFAEAPLKVEMIVATPAPLIRQLSLVGSVEATKSFPASFRNGGQINFLDADAGRFVAAGEVIARIDATNVRAALDAARANLNAAEAALVQAEQARDRTRNMLTRGVGTQAQYDEAEQAYLEAAASRDQATALLETAQQALEDTVLSAEQDVIVTEKFADFGEVVSAGTAVVELAPEGKRQAVFLAPDAAGLSDMRGHEIVLDPSGSMGSFSTTVSEVLPVLTETGTVEIHADIPADLAGQIPLGASITGRASLSTVDQIALPWEVLSANADGPAVWLVDPATNTVTLHPVRISIYTDEVVSIAEGLAPGDRVVAAGSHLLYDGRKVQPLQPAEGTE
ncbi:efflux RND transporter periplasmic adaptor subunit [Celeribacter neptunius]|uniref:RND family efflux transporter, MFP subunit n=1 Tax=Celeribacter neptunius TaxID=588602 RepID=A0A1I3UG94_9RHOB|nr:efflux RND transporter periplasmic adaptor subunit [Celeribacter neptunius]SFJ82050.1 RND family efflux transporter, MFP subunit [Celeribacter neptunius]